MSGTPPSTNCIEMSITSEASPRAGRKWHQWYSSEDTTEERNLILKLDMLIVPYSFVVYWIKYVDQSNISTSSNTVSFPFWERFPWLTSRYGR